MYGCFRRRWLQKNYEEGDPGLDHPYGGNYPEHSPGDPYHAHTPLTGTPSHQRTLPLTGMVYWNFPC